MKVILKCKYFSFLNREKVLTLIIVFFSLLLTNCVSPYQLPSQYNAVSKTQEVVQNPHFKVGEESLYRATITAYGYTFNGLLATKMSSENTWRVALTTDFGNTLFDFENQNGKIKTNYVTPDLNRKIVIRTLTDDFDKLLKPYFTVIEEYSNNTTQVWKCKDGADFIYLFKTSSSLQFTQLNTKKKTKYTTYLYTSENTITIEHHTLNIKIVLIPL